MHCEMITTVSLVTIQSYETFSYDENFQGLFSRNFHVYNTIVTTVTML